MRIVTIDEALFPSDEAEAKAVFHELIARELDFPHYYGHNLSALDDCLGDICTRTRIIIKRTTLPPVIDEEFDFRSLSWFDRACRVFERAARENEYLDVSIELDD